MGGLKSHLAMHYGAFTLANLESISLAVRSLSASCCIVLANRERTTKRVVLRDIDFRDCVADQGGAFLSEAHQIFHQTAKQKRVS